MTTATLRRSGGSVILSIPKALADSMGVMAESTVRLALRGRTLTVTPGYAIDDLVEKMTPENSHEFSDIGERGAERIDW